MAIHVLIATATRGYGELIQQTLMGSGGYRTALVSSAQQAIQHSENNEFNLAILDCDLPDLPLDELADRLTYILPDLRIIIIPTEDDSDIQALNNIQPDGYLSKPFYMPDLIATLDEALGVERSHSAGTGQPEGQSFHWGEPADASGIREGASREADMLEFKEVVTDSEAEKAINLSEMPWLEDMDKAAQYLARLSLSSAAQAALITKGDRLWAYAGQLPQAAMLELAEIIIGNKSKANIRTRRESDLARFIHLAEMDGDYLLYKTDLSEDMVLAMAFDAGTPFSEIRIQTGALARALVSPPEFPEFPEQDWEQEQGERRLASEGQDSPGLRGLDLWDQEIEEDVQPSRSVGPLFSPQEVPPPTPEQKTVEGYSEFRELTEEGPSVDYQAIPVDEVDDVTRALSVPEDHRRLSPVFQALYHITYACVLIPRLPEHKLSGDLAESLAAWARQISFAFNWRLEYINVQSDYLLWIANTPPELAPGSLMDSVRKFTSERIFNQFPRYKRQNPSGDFWAPGYLILNGAQTPPEDIIQAYVHQTRRLQGAQW
jgi:DNA-binding response OmpR family regulator/REP element-mobilizing transposase RayT